MRTIQYSNGIRIVDATFRSGGKAAEGFGLDPDTQKFGIRVVPMDDWEAFQKSTIDALKAIDQLPTGHRMLQEINSSGHVISIGNTWVERTDLAPGPQMTNSCYSGESAAQFYQSISTPQALSAALLGAASALKSQANAALSEALLYAQLRDTVATCCASLVWKQPASPWDQGWEVVSVTINSTHESFLMYALEAFLVRGSGAAATIRWNAASTQFVEGMTEKVKASKTSKGEHVMGSDFINRPPHMSLAHELVHGWRAVTGRCIFNSQGLLHDEHMTVGLLPRTVTPNKQYTGMADIARQGQLLALLRLNVASGQITENRMREDAGMALRPVY
jgi:hypothetical protein